MKNLLMTIALSMSSSIATAQSFNVNFGRPTSPTPAATYGAAAGQAGAWNTVFNFGKTYLQDVSGEPTDVYIQRLISGSAQADDIVGASQNDNILMKSYWYTFSATESVTIGGLSIGQYQFYLYGWGGVGKNSGITVFHVGPGADKNEYQLVWGPAWQGQVQNSTYAVAGVTKSTNSSIDISLPYADGSHPMVINGIQIVQVPAPTAGALLASALLVGMRRRR